MKNNSRKIVIPALLMFLCSAYAQASVTVHNCTDNEIRACFYKGSDEVDMIAYTDRKISPGQSHSVDCKSGNSDFCARVKIEALGGACFTTGHINRVKSGTYYYAGGEEINKEKPASCH